MFAKMARSRVTVPIFVFVSVLVGKSVCQPVMTISPAEVVLTTSAPANTVLTCSISSGISINTIYNMQILRMRESLDSELDPICQADSNGKGFLDDAPNDIRQRGNVTGGLDTNTYTASTLVLTIPTENVLCNDKGTYQCKLVYQGTDNNVYTLVANNTMSLYAIPGSASIVVRKNGVQLANASTSTLEVDVSVGEVVDFECTANIGSDNTTLVRWRRTSEFGSQDTFIPYNPQQGTYSDGTASASTTGCSYTRVATMSYNVTQVDANRDNNLAFQCFVTVTGPNSQTYSTPTAPSYYINPGSSSSGGDTDESTGETASAGSANIGAIIGGLIGGLVLITVIVVAVWWFNARGGDGNSYRTKEETGYQPNSDDDIDIDDQTDQTGSNPNLVDTYATVNKEKKNPNQSRGHKPSYENDGMDEEQTGRHYMNHHDFNDTGRYGRSNRAMDDDDYSQDGAPASINHMGMDPSNGGYGTGV